MLLPRLIDTLLSIVETRDLSGSGEAAQAADPVLPSYCLSGNDRMMMLPFA
jgi:hypothetical protein